MNNAERFWAKVNKDGRVYKTGKCWEWTGALDKNEYGRFYLNGKKIKAHRLSYILHHPDDDFDLWEHREICVCHTCDNPGCVNPSHLFLGSKADNNKDKTVKGRGKGQYGRGEKNILSKLTETQVREIRTRYAEGGVTQLELGIEYGVHFGTISRIILRKTWSHI